MQIAGQHQGSGRAHLAAGAHMDAVDFKRAGEHPDALGVHRARGTDLCGVQLEAVRGDELPALYFHAIEHDAHQRRQEARNPGRVLGVVGQHVNQQVRRVQLGQADGLPGERQDRHPA